MDSLQSFWKNVFGATHALVVADAFFEHVSRHRLEGRELAHDEKEEDVVLRFAPSDGKPMEAACLWAHWYGDGGDLLSFSAITDEPPPEVQAAGHDRCIVPLKHEHVAQWLAAQDSSQAQHLAILKDKVRPYYEHLLAA